MNAIQTLLGLARRRQIDQEPEPGSIDEAFDLMGSRGLITLRDVVADGDIDAVGLVSKINAELAERKRAGDPYLVGR